jgi:hypothetical protein
LSKIPNINNLRSSGKTPTFTLNTEFGNKKYVLSSVAVYRHDCGNKEQSTAILSISLYTIRNYARSKIRQS